MKDTRSHKIHHCDDGKVVKAAADKDFVSSIKAATGVPRSTFQLYVWSDEGINLQVELNSSQSDWTNRFRNEVHTSDSVDGNKSWSLRQCLSGLVENSTREKSSFLWNTSSGQIDDHDGQDKSFSSLNLTKEGVAQLNKHNKGDRPLTSNSLTPCGMTVKVANNLQENQSAVSAEVSYDARNHFISGTESFAKDASKKVFASDATNTPFKSLSDFVHHSLSDPGTLEPQNSKPENECSEDCALANCSCIVNPRVVCAGASLNGLLGLQEVASCHKYAAVLLCDKGGSLDLSDSQITSDTLQGRLVNSSEINFVIDANNFTSITEEGEAAKTVYERESSECSQFRDPLKKSCRDSDDQVSVMELHKKRKNKEFEIQDSSDKPAARILRSMTKTKTVDGRETSECSQLGDPRKKSSQDPDEQVSKTGLRQKRKNKDFEIPDSTDKPAARFLRSMTKTKAVDGGESLECIQFGDPVKKSSQDSDDQVPKTELHKKRKNREFEIQESIDKPAARVLRSMMKIKIVVGRESSECSQFGDTLKKSSQDSNGRVSEMELHKKRENKDFEIQDSSDKPAARILRSMTKTKNVNGREISQCPQFSDLLKKTSRDSVDQVSKTELHKKRENEEFEIQYSSARILRSMTKTKTVDGRESSECPQFGDPLKKTSRDFDDQVSKTELHKKRENGEFENQDSSDKPSARNLRSMTKTKIVDGRESSGCPQFGDPLKKSSRDSDYQVSKTEHYKKREYEEFEIQDSARILRSMTKIAVTAALPRRSMRLISE